MKNNAIILLISIVVIGLFLGEINDVMGEMIKPLSDKPITGNVVATASCTVGGGYYKDCYKSWGRTRSKKKARAECTLSVYDDQTYTVDCDDKRISFRNTICQSFRKKGIIKDITTKVLCEDYVRATKDGERDDDVGKRIKISKTSDNKLKLWLSDINCWDCDNGRCSNYGRNRRSFKTFTCEVDVPETPIECTDSDRGKKILVKGTTSGLDWGSDTFVTKTDYCITEGEKAGRLNEYYCFLINGVYRVRSESFGPEKGCAICQNGACEDLSDYPNMFAPKFNGTIIVGDTAPASDTLAAVDIASSLQQILGLEEPVDVKLDSEILPFITKNLITIGNPCDNKVTSEFIDCSQWSYNFGQAMIKLFPNKGYYVIVVAGTDAESTRAAARILAQYKSFNLKGQEVCVTGGLQKPQISYGTCEDCTVWEDTDGDGCDSGLDSDCGGIEGVDDSSITCFDKIDNDCDGTIDQDDPDLSCA